VKGLTVGTGFELPGDWSPGTPPTFGSVRRGYDPTEVDAFLAQVASSIQILETRLRQATQDTLEDTPDDDTDRLAERFARVLAIQEHEAESLLTEAHAEAGTMVAGAKREADRIRNDGRDAAERSVDDAHAFRERAADEADHLRADLAERHREMIESLPQIRQRLLMFLHDVEATLGSIQDPAGAERSTSGEVVDKDPSTTEPPSTVR
jgi:DivIVA domain-containing protein